MTEVQMFKIRKTPGLCLLMLVAVVSAQTQESIAMYLCVEEMAKNSGHGKLVYGYIDGKKTPCMSEYQFRNQFYSVHSESLPQPSMNQKQFDFSTSDDVVKSVAQGNKNLSGLDLKGMDLSNCKLRGIDFTNTDLSGADLRGADLRNANLTNANLTRAYLKNCDLGGADLSGAILKGAYLHRADCTGAKGLTLSELKTVRTVHDATMDSVLIQEIKQQCATLLRDPGYEWRLADK
jgi:hypothetical protein